MTMLDDFLARIRHQGDRMRQLELLGPADMLGDALPQPLGTAWKASQYLPLGLAPDMVDLLLDASGEVAKMATGLGIQGAAVAPWAHQDIKQAAQDARDADLGPLATLRQTNEMFAAEHPLITGVNNVALDPTNLATPVAKGLGLIDDVPKLATPARGVLERLDDFKAGAGVVKDAVKLSYDQGKLAQGLAEKGGREVQVLYKKGPKQGQVRSTKWENLRLSLDPHTAWGNVKQQLVLNPRNLTQDYGNNRLWAREAGIPGDEVNHAIESMVANAKGGGLHPKEVLPSRMSKLLEDFGWRGGFNTQQELGMGFLDANAGEADRFLSPWVSAGLEGAWAATNPLRGGIPILGILGAGVKGYYRPLQNAAFSSLSHVIQGGFRSVGWEVGFSDELAKRAQQLYTRLPKQYGDELARRSQQRYNDLAALGENMSMYDPASLFTPAELDTVLRMRFKKPNRKAAAIPRFSQTQRDALVQAWTDDALAAREVGSRVTKNIFKDFSQEPTDAQRYLDYAVPFLGWARRAYPKTIEIAANHPTASLILYKLMEADAENAEAEGRPSWQVGTIPFDTDTPLVGGPLRLLADGRDAEARLDVMQGLMPLPGGSLGGVTDLDEAETPYDKLRAAFDIAGAGFSPPLEYAAYALGMTDKPPRSVSRTAGLEASAPGPTMPSLSNGALNFIREQQDKFGISDPVVNVAKELVFEKTGLPVSDPANKQYALEIERRTGVYEEAKNVYEGSGASRNVLSLFNPFGLSVQSETGAEARGALAQRPFDGNDLQRLREENPQAAVIAAQLNNAYKQANPEAAVYDNPRLTAADKRDPRLLEWEDKHDNLKVIAPGVYATLRTEFMKANGIRE